MDPAYFKKKLLKNGINLTEYQMEQFDMYFQILIEWNQKMNLTSLTEKTDVYLKHFFDSASAAFYYDFNQKLHICDVGAGAGFPSIPLKICFPQLSITIIDSLKKRIGFLEYLKEKLQINNVSFYHGRAEDFGRSVKFREQYDLVIARAVARMSVLSELCLPLSKKNGVFVAMKGSKAMEEVETAKKAIKTMGGEFHQVYTFSLPQENSERSIVIIDKKRKSPKQYPRKAGTPNKSPIE